MEAQSFRERDKGLSEITLSEWPSFHKPEMLTRSFTNLTSLVLL